jgi:subtilase family serine protease
MMRPSLISLVAVVAALSWGCVPDSDSPSPTGLSLSMAASGDFEYIARPPNVRVVAGTVAPDGLPFCGSGLVCYTPNYVRAAYNFPSNLDGRGQTILIVDAFGSPTVAQDLATFDTRFGIPAPPSFTIFCPQGCPAFAPNNTPHGVVSWSIETSLDVQYAHAMAPGANIVLVVAASSSGNAINVAEAAAIERYPGAIMSQSFGIPEIAVHDNNAQIMQAHANYEAARAAGITVLASAGDFGATNGYSTANAGFPASDPLVTGVGGTQGNPYLPPFTPASCAVGPCNTGLATVTGPCASGSISQPPCAAVGYGGEQVWNEPDPRLAVATGGAPSKLFGVPSYQNGLGLATRGTPDVAYNAAVNGGVLVVWTAIPALAGIYIVGGTSAGSPQWASIVALANQLKDGPVGFINPTLYRIACSGRYSADFHDITVGNNQLVGTPVGFAATHGWDSATGLGTPNVANLIQDLVAPPSCP